MKSAGRAILRLALVAVAAITPVSSPADAQADEAGDPQRAEAARLFNLGRIAFREERYDEAILRWQESHALSKEPLILYNIGLAYEKLGEYRRAAEHLRAWREHAKPEEHAALDRRIEELEEAAAEQPSVEEPAEVEPPPIAVAPPPRPNQAATPPDRSEGFTVAALSLIGIGGTAVVAGIVIDIVAAANRPSEEEACVADGSRLLCREDFQTEIENANTLAIAGDVTWIAGAALAGAGLLMLLLAPDETSSESGLRVVPQVSHEGGSVAISIPF